MSRVLIVVEETLLRIEHLPMPTLAVLYGWALGAGCKLAMACDLRVAEAGTVVGLPVARFGLIAHNCLVKRAVRESSPAVLRAAKPAVTLGVSLPVGHSTDAGAPSCFVDGAHFQAAVARFRGRHASLVNGSA